jgi:UDP:flavonoid glycosyltransferase YjiC (YdhE family)
MRVLITSKAGAGHLGPLLPFAHALRRARADVLIATPREAAPMVRAQRLPLWAFDDPPPDERDAIFAEVGRLPPELSGPPVVGDVFARIDARAAYPGILAACRAWKPDIVMSEMTEFAGPLVAEALGLPAVTVAILQMGKGAAMLESAEVRSALEDLRAQFGLDPDPDLARARSLPCLTLLPEALEDPAMAPPLPVMRFREVPDASRGPLWDWWLGDERPLVYITFGSAAPKTDLFPGVYRAAIDAVSAMSVRALVTIGRDRDPAELGPVSSNVRVEQWVPQQDVMPHAAAMACHGGSGTVTMGLAAGVPMAVLPLFADQPWNAERVAALGAGIALAGEPDAPAIRNAVGRLLAEPAYLGSARRVAAQMRALPPVDAAVGVVRELLADVLAA